MSSIETMRSWPRLVTCPGDIPEVFGRAVASRYPSLPYTVYLPVPASPFSPQFEHLLCMGDRELVVFTWHRKQLSVESIDLAALSYTENGKVLLFSWLALFTGQEKRRFPFNTVREDLMSPVVLHARRVSAASPAPTEAPAEELAKFDYLRGPGYKFMNYGRRSLMGGERVKETLFEPSLVVRTIRLFGRHGIRKYSTPHLWIASDREIIIVREERELVYSNRIRYGAVMCFVPLRSLEGATVQVEDGAARIVLAIRGGERLGGWFALDNPRLETFTEAIGARRIEEASAARVAVNRRAEIKASRGYDGLAPDEVTAEKP